MKNVDKYLLVSLCVDSIIIIVISFSGDSLINDIFLRNDVVLKVLIILDVILFGLFLYVYFKLQRRVK